MSTAFGFLLSVPRLVSLLFSMFFSSSNLTNTNTSKNNKRKLIQIRKLVLVRRLGEVADLGDVDNGVAEVVLCAKKKSVRDNFE